MQRMSWHAHRRWLFVVVTFPLNHRRLITPIPPDNDTTTTHRLVKTTFTAIPTLHCPLRLLYPTSPSRSSRFKASRRAPTSTALQVLTGIVWRHWGDSPNAVPGPLIKPPAAQERARTHHCFSSQRSIAQLTSDCHGYSSEQHISGAPQSVLSSSAARQIFAMAARAIGRRGDVFAAFNRAGIV